MSIFSHIIIRKALEDLNEMQIIFNEEQITKTSFTAQALHFYMFQLYTNVFK